MRGDVIEVWIEAPPEERDRLIAELYALGTLGLEERDTGLAVYFPKLGDEDPVWSDLERLADAERGIRVRERTRVPPTDWEREWRRGLAPRQVAGLWLRPSWCESRGEPEICIDPEQAFGSGEHATTRLALELLRSSLRPGDDLLDVGTGSGVLALAGLCFGARRAVAFDLDRVACGNARDNARRNRLAPLLFAGGIEALRPERGADVAVANLLWAELEPCLDAVLARARRELVVSGSLVRERDRVCTRVRAAGLELRAERSESQSGDDWWGGRFVRAEPGCEA